MNAIVPAIVVLLLAVSANAGEVKPGCKFPSRLKGVYTVQISPCPDSPMPKVTFEAAYAFVQDGLNLYSRQIRGGNAVTLEVHDETKDGTITGITEYAYTGTGNNFSCSVQKVTDKTRIGLKNPFFHGLRADTKIRSFGRRGLENQIHSSNVEGVTVGIKDQNDDAITHTFSVDLSIDDSCAPLVQASFDGKRSCGITTYWFDLSEKLTNDDIKRTQVHADCSRPT